MQQRAWGNPFNESLTADQALRTGGVGVCYVAAQPEASKQQTAEGRARYRGEFEAPRVPPGTGPS